MRLASSSGRLVCALLALAELSFGAGCEAMNELPARKPADVADQVAERFGVRLHRRTVERARGR
jgi:hypothetical protein